MDVLLLDGLILASIWVSYTMLLFGPCTLLVGRFVILFVYAPLLVIFLKKPHVPPSYFFLALESVLWDWPLIFWIRLLSFVGRRALRPFYSQINTFISIGSLPLHADVPFLAKKRVGAVVSMCREWRGPQEAYAQHNMLYFACPTADNCEPSYNALLNAVRFMRLFKQSHHNHGGSRNSSKTKKRVSEDDHGDDDDEDDDYSNNNKRIFVHCKGGRARAVTCALCFLISEGMAPEEAFELIKAKRRIAEASVLRFRVVARFVKELAAVGGDFDKLEFEPFVSES